MTTRNQRRARARKGQAERLAKAKAVQAKAIAQARAIECTAKREAHEALTDGARFAAQGWQQEAGALRPVMHKPVDGRKAYAAIGRTPQGEARFKVVRKVVKAKRFSAS